MKIKQKTPTKLLNVELKDRCIRGFKDHRIRLKDRYKQKDGVKVIENHNKPYLVIQLL